MFFFDVLTRKDCEIIRLERNKTKGILRTNFLLTEDMQTEFYNNIVNNRNSNNRFFAIRKIMYPNDGNEIPVLFGMIGFTNINLENRNAEISLFLRKIYQKKGNGNLILNEFLKYGFYEMNLENIYGECYKCNPYMNFWIKNISRYTGYSTLLPNTKYFNGKYFDSIYFNFSKKDISKKYLEEKYLEISDKLRDKERNQK